MVTKETLRYTRCSFLVLRARALAVALTTTVALSMLAGASRGESPINRDAIRVVEKEGVQLARTIKADSTRTVDSLREKGSASEIQAGMERAFVEWKEQMQQLAELPSETPFRAKASELLHAERDSLFSEMSATLKAQQAAIEDAFGGLVADNGKRFDRPVAARQKLVNQSCNALQVAFDNATTRLSHKRIDFVRQMTEAAEREAEAERERNLAKQRVAENAMKAAEEAVVRRNLAEQRAREEAARLRNSTPAWGGGVDLDDFVKRSGLNFAAFVRFGTAELARKAEGDRFDRMEAEKGAAAHADKLADTTFVWTAESFTCLDDDVPSDRPDVVKQFLLVDLPFRVDDLQAALGPNVSVWDSAGNQGKWYLTKDNALAAIDSGSALVAVRRNNGIIYVPDSRTSQLRVCVSGSLEDMKDLARNSKNYVVQFQVAGLGTKKALNWGFYQVAAAPKFDWHSPAMRLSQAEKIAKGGADATEPPVYFLTEKFPDTPELVVGSIKRVEVARVAGDARKVLFTVEAQKGRSR